MQGLQNLALLVLVESMLPVLSKLTRLVLVALTLLVLAELTRLLLAALTRVGALGTDAQLLVSA